MNIFFGKISKKYDLNQINEGYYISKKHSTWFGGLEVGDYAFIIGGDKIQFWKAKEWGTKDGKDCMWFEMLNKDLEISLAQFLALKFFKFTPAFIVLTSRSARNKAFFKLDQLQSLSVDFLADSKSYENNDLYRKIIISSSFNDEMTDSIDLQLFYDQNELKLYNADFIDDDTYKKFRNNLPFVGKGSVRKDSIMRQLKSKEMSPTAAFSYNEISLRDLYDAFFCEYKEKTKYYLVGAYWGESNPKNQLDRFLEDSIWENGYHDKFTNIVNEVPEGSPIAVKSTFTKNKTESAMKIKARGTVLKNLNNGRHLEIEWEDDFIPFEVNFSGGNYRNTIAKVKKQEHINTIWLNDNKVNNTVKNQEKEITKTHSLNQILYGPPGTGKTYHTIDLAAEIVTGKKCNNHNESKTVFDKLKKEGQIEFVTFHQNYTYEDFLVGISPDVTAGTLRFDKKDGIFKQITDRARKNWMSSTQISDVQVGFETVFNRFFNHLIEEETQSVEVEMRSKGYSFHITSIDVDGGRIKFTKKSGGTSHDLLIKNVQGLYEGTADYSQEGLGVYYHPLNAALKQYAQDNQLEEVKTEYKNYVIIIDEINRANISRVFGELITLLEDDKRLGEPNELKVTLPNGEKDFGIPPNLYIIGTMNTADKSIALLDVALRRRFEFVGYYPDYSKIKDESAAKLLQKINTEIYKRKKSADYLIGHAYFMKGQSVEKVLDKSIIPLLMEYFSGKTTIVSDIFDNTDWEVKYDEKVYSWKISKTV